MLKKIRRHHGTALFRFLDSDRPDDWTDISCGEQVMSALEAMQWHESSVPAERSDESFMALRKFELVERRPVVRELTDTERFDFLDEECLGISEKEASDLIPRVVTVTCKYGNITGKGRDWRAAVDMAKAKWDEANS